MLYNCHQVKPGQFSLRAGRITPAQRKTKSSSSAWLPLESISAAGPAQIRYQMIKSDSEPYVGTHLATQSYLMYRRPEIFMNIDPFLFIDLLKQITADEEAKQRLLSWLKQASLLSFQAQGSAVSELLVLALRSDFNSIMLSLVRLDNDPANRKTCDLLCKQICQFYSWLDTQQGKTEPQLDCQWQSSCPSLNPYPVPKITDCRILPAADKMQNQHPDTASQCRTHSLNYSKYD